MNQGNLKIITDEEKAQLLSDIIVSAYNLTSAYMHSNDKFFNSKVNQFKSAYTTYSENIFLISLNEINSIIATLKRLRRSPKRFNSKSSCKSYKITSDYFK